LKICLLKQKNKTNRFEFPHSMLNEQEINSNKHLSASFTLKETKGDLKVVVSWLDPLMESTAIYLMFTSIDHSVFDPSGIALLGAVVGGVLFNNTNKTDYNWRRFRPSARLSSLMRNCRPGLTLCT
jgi:hypothetical protein